jgi:putative DNA primase/helicase
MAAVLQDPATKPRHQLLILGRTQGTGKTFFARLMRELLGRSNCQMLTQDIIEAGFTGWAMRTKFVWIEEVRDMTSTRKATSKLHSWASEGTITVNQKNLPTFVMDQAIAFMLMSNKDDPLALDLTDRRYLILRTEAKVHPQGRVYYDALYGVHGRGGILNDPASLGAILHELLTRDLGSYTIESEAPFTEAKQQTLDAAQSPEAKWMIEHSGEAPMRYRVVTPDEIVEAMPRRLQTRFAGDAVREALRDRFGGKAWPQQIRPDGRSGDKVRVWLIGDAEKLAGKLTSATVLRMWREDRDRAAAEDAAREADDFAD